VVDIVAVGSGWHVVDTSVPGWVTLERHSERWRAEAALERLLDGRGEAIEEGAGEAVEELERLLDGRVGVVRSRLSQVSSIAVLDRLRPDVTGHPKPPRPGGCGVATQAAHGPPESSDATNGRPTMPSKPRRKKGSLPRPGSRARTSREKEQARKKREAEAARKRRQKRRGSY